MDIDWSVWGPPLAVLVAGIVMGVVTLGRMRTGSGDPSIGRESRKIDLESARDEVLEALKQLELDRDKMPPDAYARERESLVSRGARALEALDEPVDSNSIPTRPPVVIAPEWRGALYALGAVLLLAILWNFATSETVERRDGASMTGNQAVGGGGEGSRAAIQDSPKFKARVAELEGKLQANANDVGALNDLTHMFMMVSDYPKAFGYNDTALKAAPTDADARTYRAALTAMMSMPDKALEQFDALLAEKPDHAMAIVYRAMVLFQTGKVDEAIASLEAATKKYPDNDDLRSAYEQASQAAAQSPGEAAPPAAAGGDMLVSGTVTLDPASAATLKGSETLFLSIADPARPRPPVAADKRAGPLQFPMPFSLTMANKVAMPGAGEVPEVFDLKVRIDLDGNAMTQEPGTPTGTITGVHRGTNGLALTLTLDGAPQAAPAGGGSSLLAPIAAPPGSPPAAGGDVLAAGVAALDPGSAALSGSEVVFVSVRDPAGGPPLASKKVPAQFPLQFEVTSADIISMGGARPIPDTFNVTVRVDRDGNATSKDGEPEAVATGVKKGSAQLQLTLK